jgi:hypothetical protein
MLVVVVVPIAHDSQTGKEMPLSSKFTIDLKTSA